MERNPGDSEGRQPAQSKLELRYRGLPQIDRERVKRLLDAATALPLGERAEFDLALGDILKLYLTRVESLRDVTHRLETQALRQEELLLHNGELADKLLDSDLRVRALEDRLVRMLSGEPSVS